MASATPPGDIARVRGTPLGKPGATPDDSHVASALLVEMRNRIRELSEAVARAEEREAGAKHDCERRLREARLDKESVQKKLRAEREEVVRLSEELKRKTIELEVIVQRQMTPSSGVEADDSQLSWDLVAKKNIAMQKLREKESQLQRALAKEKKLRANLQKERDEMARKLEPLQQKNLEMEYRHSLQKELWVSAANEVESLQDTLDRERVTADRMSKQAQTSRREREAAVEDAAAKYLQMQDLSAANRDLVSELELAEGARHAADEALARAEETARAHVAERSRLTESLAGETAHRRAAEEERDETREALRHAHAELDETQAALEGAEAQNDALGEQCTRLEAELGALREVLHAPALDHKRVHYTQKAKYMAAMNMARLQEMRDEEEHLAHMRSRANNGAHTAR
mmetsp:Transcript_14658/g.48118  ORF Transcript_14658/g.48118 Transcript_14658/m.48118 type:complete len:405 (+) Transcript_14658:1428-2642(+)